MAESLHDLLSPYLKSNAQSLGEQSSLQSATVKRYLNRLTTLPLSALTTTELQSLEQSSQTNLLSLQALASRSYKSVTSSANHLSSLRTSLPTLRNSANTLRDAIPQLDEKVVSFSTAFSKSKDDNPVLDRRKEAMLLARNVDRLSDVMDLPSLLSNTIASAGSGTSASVNYTQALDLFAHINRLQILYPKSDIVRSVVLEAEDAMKDMTANLITSLRGQNVRLAAAIRTVGWLRRVSPELDQPTFYHSEQPSRSAVGNPTGEGLFGSLFLTARLANLLHMLEALDPLRDLADQETQRRRSRSEKSKTSTTSGSYGNEGQQTECYLKRYVEIFREQSFATVSMYRNVFPHSENPENKFSLLLPLPSALASFPLHLAEMLMETLEEYLPNVKDSTGRESLLMQVLYAAGSLGRLGADFTMMISSIFDAEEDVQVIEANKVTEEEATGDEKNISDPEWVRVIQKHRVQSARLNALSSEVTVK